MVRFGGKPSKRLPGEGRYGLFESPTVSVLVRRDKSNVLSVKTSVGCKRHERSFPAFTDRAIGCYYFNKHKQRIFRAKIGQDHVRKVSTGVNPEAD